MNREWLKRFLDSLFGSVRPRWLAVVAYLTSGSTAALAGIILKDSEKVEKIILICLGALMIAIGILLIFLRPYKKN